MAVLQHLTATLQPKSSDGIARTIEADRAVLAGPSLALATHRITETRRHQPKALPYELKRCSHLTMLRSAAATTSWRRFVARAFLQQTMFQVTALLLSPNIQDFAY